MHAELLELLLNVAIVSRRRVPLGCSRLNAFAHLVQSVFEHFAEFNGHIFHLLLKLDNFLFLLKTASTKRKMTAPEIPQQRVTNKSTPSAQSLCLFL